MGGPCTIDGKVCKSTDNFGHDGFKLDGKTWVSAEQYYQAAKYKDESYIEKIRSERDGMRCWMLGQSRKYPMRPDWEEVKVDIMYAANVAKFEQNPDCLSELLSTTGAIKAKGDDFWKKWNPILLQRIRAEKSPSYDQAAPCKEFQLMEDYKQQIRKRKTK
eukprot:TRINITY_DN35838_c0_g1_i1.p1 TRINITY_DN35838_c0_g1~~TRINITY_DN35838_c0_g1_i1.p1  ORF type:complete len:175 (+),score=42.24 TRINITY_DN35838_c0_g1_i1:45-527(+)